MSLPQDPASEMKGDAADGTTAPGVPTTTEGMAAAIQEFESITEGFLSSPPQEIRSKLADALVERFCATRVTIVPTEGGTEPTSVAAIGTRPRIPRGAAPTSFPLGADGHSYGTVVVEFAAPLDAGRLELIRAVIRRAGIAIRRATELETLRGDAEMLAALYVVADAVSHPGTVAEVFQRIVSALKEVLPADHAISIFRKEDGFVPGPTAGLSDEQQRFFSRLSIGPPHLSLVAHVEETMTPEVIEDASRSPLLSPEFSSTFGIGSAIVLPLVRWGRTLGILQVHFSSPRTFSESDLAVLVGIARQASVGVENALLQQDLRERLDDLRRLQDASRAVLLAADPESLLHDVVAAGRQLFGCDASIMWVLDLPGRRLYREAFSGMDSEESRFPRNLRLEESVEGGVLESGVPVSIDLGRPEGRRYGANVRRRFGSLLAVPLRTERAAIGVMTFYHAKGAVFRPSDADVARSFAATVSLGIDAARRRRAEREVVRMFRRALIPAEVTSVPGLDIAISASLGEDELAVGGDFVEIFELEGAVGVAFGDIAGKGTEAASLGVMAKYMLRALAFRNASPSSVAYHLNRALAHTFRHERFLTLVYALYEPASRRLTLCNCGAWPPLLLTTSGGEHLEQSGGLLGAFDDQQYPDLQVALAPGDLLVGYTDGIPEARRGKETFGAERIRRLVEESSGLPPAGVASAVLEAARKFAGGSLGDDAVVVCLRARRAGGGLEDA